MLEKHLNVILKENARFNVTSHPLKSQFLRDFILPQYLSEIGFLRDDYVVDGLCCRVSEILLHITSAFFPAASMKIRMLPSQMSMCITSRRKLLMRL